MKLTKDDIREMYKMDESKPRSRWPQWMGESLAFLLVGFVWLVLLYSILLIIRAILGI